MSTPTPKHVADALAFVEDYKRAKNASTGSKYDSNANVATKCVATLQAELNKKDLIDLNRALIKQHLRAYPNGEQLAEQFEEDLRHKIIYSHDESSIMPYCVAISLYPFLLDGLKSLGGTSGPPKHVESFIGGLVNLIFLISGQFAGAVAVPETLPYLDYFLRLDYGDDYLTHLDDPVATFGCRRATLRTRIYDLFQQFVYCVNQPAGARGYQSPFYNIAYFDHGYFQSLFQDFIFPDGTEPCWETTKELQKLFMRWFNNERTKAVLTFPVETMNLLWDKDTEKYVDEEMADFTAEMWAQGHSFFLYNSDSADALSSCCRLKNAIEENVFSYTLGAGGIQTGSKKVITLNINRIVQDWDRAGRQCTLAEYITPIVDRVHKYLSAYNDYLWGLFNSDLLTIYKAGFIDLDKQYLTIGFNGFLESAEFLGIKIDPSNPEYQNYAKEILGTIKELNAAARTEHTKFNTEQVPAENLGVKNYKWDKADGYWVPSQRNCYNSYFYPVEDESYDIITKMYLQGRAFSGCLDGGSAYHCNLSEHLSKAQYRKLMDIAIKAGCGYFTFNVPNTICNECGHIDKRMLHQCPKCGSKNIDYATRIIGYLKRVFSHFSEARQKEALQRFYAPPPEETDQKDAEIL